MSRADVFKSLLRSTALGARDGLARLKIPETVRRLVDEAMLGRAVITDAQLTADVARVPGVRAATVRTDASGLRMQASVDDGPDVAIALRPAGVKFAAGGAKEVAFMAADGDGGDLDSSLGRDMVSALGGAIARKLWAPALASAPRSNRGAPVSRQGDRLYLDLRSVPEVRWAQARKMQAALVETLALKAITLEPGRVVLGIHVPGLERMR